MPVSPQDFALWSNLTGNPYPQTPAERMALAPTVYEFNKNIGRRGGPTMGPMRRTADVLGKAALAAGALAGAAYLGGKYFGGEQETPDTGISFGKLNLDDEVDVPPTGPAPGGPPTAPANLNYGDITPPTTADNFNQKLTPNQTSVAQAIRGTSPYKPTVTPIEEKPATQSEVISTRQHFSPGSEVEMLSEDAAQKAAAFRASKAYSVMQQQYPGLREIESPAQESFEAPTSLTNVQPTMRTRVATREAPVDVGTALKAKGIYLSGDSDELKINTDKGGSYHINHPYASHPKEGIRQTALQEEQWAREILGAAGVSPEQAKDYWSTKLTTFSIGAEPHQAEPVSTAAINPIAGMVQPTAQKAVPTDFGASIQETRELDTLLARTLANKSQEERMGIRNQMLSQKYGSTPTAVEQPAPPVSSQSQPIVTAPTGPVRVAREGRITPNEFLSVMSQQEGPLASYSIDPSRSKAVSGLAFYPGGEIGVQMGKRKSGPTEYAYATADPYRLALSDYAEEGFPEGMGNIGGVVADKALAHQMGLQKAVERGGTIRQQRQPLYAGLMSDADIMAAGMDKSRTAKAKQTAEQAERHFETKNIMEELEQRALRREAPGGSKAVGGFAGSPEATDFLRAAKQALISR